MKAFFLFTMTSYGVSIVNAQASPHVSSTHTICTLSMACEHLRSLEVHGHDVKVLQETTGCASPISTFGINVMTIQRAIVGDKSVAWIACADSILCIGWGQGETSIQSNFSRFFIV